MLTDNSKGEGNPLAFLNLLRFLGALCIALLLHYEHQFLANLEIPVPFSENSFIGYMARESSFLVEMFFVISGVLFSRVYVKRIEQGTRFDNFFIRRVIRMAPLAIVTSIVMYGLTCILFNLNHAFWSCGTLDLSQLILDCLFLGKPVLNANNTLNGPIWYVNILLICYIIGFLLTKLASKCGTQIIFLIPIILGFNIQNSNINTYWQYTLPRGLIAFFVGVILEKLLFYFDMISTRQKIGLRIILLVHLICVLFAATGKYANLFVQNIGNYYTFLVFPQLIILLYDCRWINRLSSTRIVTWLNDISFGIYLWNYPIYLFLHILVVGGYCNIDVTTPRFIIIVGVIHIVVAAISHVLVDKKLCGKLLKLANAVSVKRNPCTNE